MKFDLKGPCSNCPFRSDRPFFLDPDRAIEISDALLEGRTFACHKTTEHDDNDEHALTPGEQHCAGAAIILERLEQPNQLMRIAERLGSYDARALNVADAPVYPDFDHFVLAMMALANRHLDEDALADVLAAARGDGVLPPVKTFRVGATMGEPAWIAVEFA